MLRAFTIITPKHNIHILRDSSSQLRSFRALSLLIFKSRRERNMAARKGCDTHVVQALSVIEIVAC